MSFSIGTQSGNFSYQAFVRPQRDDHISFGFSFINTGDGSIEDRIVFSGESGKLYDSDNNFFYSYNNQDTFSVSGNKIGNYNNYFVNNVLINSYHENGTGYINNFTENGVVSELSLMGVEPVISISGIFENSNLTGSLKVSNNSSEGISFNIFSGRFEELSNFFNFNTGQNTGIIEGQSSRDFLINQISNVTTGTGVLIPISFVSDFGTFTKSGLISFTREYEYLLSLLGPDFLDSTGIFNYNVLFSERYGPNLTDDPFGLHFTFGNISGYGGYADYDIKTGKITGSIPGFDISRNIIGTGNLTGMIESSLGGGYLTLSGYSTGLEINYTGNIPSQIYTGETVFATGEMSYPFLTSSSGIVTGLDIGFIRNVSGGYNFTETGAIRFTGQQSLFPSFTTGIILSGNNTDGDPIVTSKNDSLCFSFDIQSFTATSNQTRNKEYASRFSGFATGAFDGIAYYPGDQAGLDITTTISGFKVSGTPGAFIATGTGVFDLIGTFPMDTKDSQGSFVNNGWTIDLSDRILTGLATGLLPEDPNLTGLVSFGTGVTGAGSNQTSNVYYSNIFSGFSSGLFDGEMRIPADQIGLIGTNIISGFKVSGTPGAFTATGTGAFDVTGINRIDMKYPIPDYSLYVSTDLTGLATGILTEDPNLTGAIFSGSEITGIESVFTTGVLTGSGIITGQASTLASGFTGIDFTYNYIAKGKLLSGMTNEISHEVTGKRYVATDLSMLGNYDYLFRSIRLGSAFSKNFTVQAQEDISSGYVDFTGQFQYSGTGAYVHPQEITGIGYAGLGLIGSISEPVKDIIFNGSSGVTGRYLTNTGALIDDSISLNGNSYGIPVSSVYTRYNPFIFSGNSGILLYSDHTNEKAPILTFSNNDAGRGSYIHNPVWLNRRLLSGTFNLEPSDMEVGISPKYFLSGTGVYKSKKSRNYKVTVYTGNNFADMIYKGSQNISVFSSMDFNERFSYRNFDAYDPFNVYFLITSNTEDLEPSGFNYFSFEDTENSKNPPEFGPRQFNTFFDSSGQGFRRFSTNYSSPTDASGYLLSADTKYPTGSTPNRIAIALPNTISVISGLNVFETGFNMTGYAENVSVEGTGMSGVGGTIEATGENAGFLYALQDKNLFPRYNIPNEIFTQMTGNFNGEKSINNFEIATGILANNQVGFLRKRVDSTSENIDGYSLGNYERIERFGIPTYQSSIEEISGIMKAYCDKIGYNVYFGSGRIGFTSDPGLTYPVGGALGLGLGTSSSTAYGPWSKDTKYATRQSGGLYTLIETGIEVATQGSNLPYSGIMSGKVATEIPTTFATGYSFFNSGVSGNIYNIAFTGMENTTSKYFISSLNQGDIYISSFTSSGIIPSIGFGTGIDQITVLAGQKSGDFVPTLLNMFPFSGTGVRALSNSPPLGGDNDLYADNYIFSGVRTGISFATGADSTGALYGIAYTGIQTGPARWYIENLDFNGDILDLDATVTGYVPTIASGTGIDPITILAGQQSGEFDQAILNMLPFSGVNLQTLTYDQPVGGFEDSYADNFIYSGVRKGFNFATGILTGSFDYTGILNFTQRNLQKTGVKIGIGVISGNITGIVYPGSGEFNFSGIQTGLPQFINSVVPTGQEVFLLSSGNVPITPFTGNLNSSFIGTGFYTDFVNPADLESLSYDFPIPNYIKTFTGEYEILTGINNTGFAKCTGFFNIPSINLTGYSGYVVLTGDDDLNIQMVKKKYFADSVDLNIIKYSGIGTLDASYDNTGSLTFIG